MAITSTSRSGARQAKTSATYVSKHQLFVRLLAVAGLLAGTCFLFRSTPDRSRATIRGDVPFASIVVPSITADEPGPDTSISRRNLECAADLPGADGLDSTASLATLTHWARHVAHETERHVYRFRANPAEFNNSLAYFRMLMLIVALQQDCGVRYNPERISTPDFANSQDLFIHGMLPESAPSHSPAQATATRETARAPEVNGGTCVSMPVLYVAVGRLLGYPLRLAVTKGHVFARWDDGRERFNIEGTHPGLSTPSDDEYKAWPYRLTESEVSGDWYLRSLTADEERGLFMLQRGYCLEANGRLAEAAEAYAEACRLAPKSPEAVESLLLVQRKITDHSTAGARLAARTPETSKEWLARKRREAEEYARARTECPPLDRLHNQLPSTSMTPAFRPQPQSPDS